MGRNSQQSSEEVPVTTSVLPFPSARRVLAAVVAVAAVAAGVGACGDDGTTESTGSSEQSTTTTSEQEPASTTTTASERSSTTTTDSAPSTSTTTGGSGGSSTTTAVDPSKPGITVTSPPAGATVSLPFQVTGEANTFESTVVFEVVGPDGAVVAQGYATAAAGTGQWGPYSFTVDGVLSAPGPGTISVYEQSPEDGSRQLLVEVPVQLTT